MLTSLSPTTPAVSILIPCRNEKDHIEGCIRSILKQQAPEESYEVIIADGMSDDGTREILQRLSEEDPRIRVIDNPGRIVSTGLNEAISSARGRIIIRMDAHTSYAPNYIQECIKVLTESGADNVGGPWVAKGAGKISCAIAAAFQSPFGVGGARGHDPNFEGIVDTVYLGCWPKDVFAKHGPFDEELVRNQDDEYNLRITRNGGRIYQSPRIRSWYRPRGSLRALFRQYMQYGYWKVRVIQKHKLPASLRHLIPGCFVLSVICLPLIALGWFPAIWAWGGVVGLYGLLNLLASISTARQKGWGLIWVLPIVFACYHFAYGVGFLRGIWDFVVIRKGPQEFFTKLSRQTASHS